jgi:hypothetical protein
MTYQDPNRPPRPEIDPLPPGATPPLYRNVDHSGNWSTGIIMAAVVALLAVMAVIMWTGPTDQQTANNPPATTGQGEPPRIAR